jgi:hypothetical protein
LTPPSTTARLGDLDPTGLAGRERRRDDPPNPALLLLSGCRLAARGLRRRPALLIAGRWRWRWRGRRRRAGDCAEGTTRCRPDGRPRTAACRTADGRAGPCADQTATDRSLAGVIGVCARRQTKRKRQRNPARRKKCLRHVLTCATREIPWLKRPGNCRWLSSNSAPTTMASVWAIAVPRSCGCWTHFAPTGLSDAYVE